MEQNQNNDESKRNPTERSEGADQPLLSAVIDANDIARAKYSLNDNYGRPRVDYVKKLLKMDDKELKSETYDMIYHSARCSNNSRADWHWMVDACYDVCMVTRGNSDIYKRAYDACYGDHCR